MTRPRVSKIGENPTKSANPIKEVKKAKKSLQNQKVNKGAKKIVATKGLSKKSLNIVNKYANNLGYDTPKTKYDAQIQRLVKEGRLVGGLASPKTSGDMRGVHRSKAVTNAAVKSTMIMEKKHQKHGPHLHKLLHQLRLQFL